jgi:internalin A
MTADTDFPFVSASGADFVDVWNCRPLLAYFRELSQWHGFIQFLGLGLHGEYQDVRTERLFVEPQLSPRLISPDEEETSWRRLESVWEALEKRRRLFILGDPGSGKSTLINWITGNLIGYGENPYRRALGSLVPFPFVLRDLVLSGVRSWDDLLAAFLEQPKAAALRTETALIEHLFRTGQAIALFDGFDEVGGGARRRAVADAIGSAMAAYPDSRFMMSSRIVGFDGSELFPDVWPKVEKRKPSALQSPHPDFFSGEEGDEILAFREAAAEELDLIRYLAPFSLEQVWSFCCNWYGTMESNSAQAEAKYHALTSAIIQEQRLQSIARVPNLLTMMALVHRNNGYLPDGRVELYHAITNAYLESIDRFRKFDPSNINYTLDQQKAWLARVAWEAQQLRDGQLQADQNNGEQERPVLIPYAVLSDLVAKAIRDDGVAVDPQVAAEEWLGHVARRSGLLIPKAEGLYAFTHLSFQEYFAAHHLRREIARIASLMFEQPSQAGRIRKKFVVELRRYSEISGWHETLVLLFESLSGDWAQWAEILLQEMYPRRDDAALQKESTQRLELLAVLAMDSVIVLPRSRDALLASLWRVELAHQARLEKFWEKTVTYRVRIKLLSRSAWLGRSWDSLLSVAGECNQLNLDGAPITNLSPLAGLASLRELHLDNTGLTDLSPLADLTSLQELYLDNTGGTDLSPLAGLASLRWLSLTNTGVTDLSPLAGLTSLEWLFLDNTGVTDLSPLAGLVSLRWLSLLSSNIGVTDLSPLAGLTSLEWLFLNNTGVTDLSPLASLASLRELHLDNTKVTDLSPLTNLKDLKILGILDDRPRRNDGVPT